MADRKPRGGKFATPVRQMLANDSCDGIIFHCDDMKRAESARVCALILKERNGYDYKTSVRDNTAVIYKPDREWGDVMMNIDLRDKERRK